MNIADFLMKIFLGASGGNGGGMANPVEISKQILAQLKSVLKSLIVVLICSVVFCLLMGYLIDRTLTQLDAGAFEITNSIIFLVVLIVIDLIVMILSLKKASAKDEAPVKEIQPVPRSSDSPIETAIAALILTFIKERETAKSNEVGPLQPDETSSQPKSP